MLDLFVKLQLLFPEFSELKTKTPPPWILSHVRAWHTVCQTVYFIDVLYVQEILIFVQN